MNQFNVGDTVRVDKTLSIVRELQKGEWNGDMEEVSASPSFKRYSYKDTLW